MGTADEVNEVIRVVGKLPVNVLVGAPGFTRGQLEEPRVKRISTEGALARAASGRSCAARDTGEHGHFDAFGGLPSSKEIEAAFGRTR